MTNENKNIVLVLGPPNSGKSASLRNLTNQKEWVYLNSDLKELPFKDNFSINAQIKDANHILEYIKQIEENPKIKGAVIDTITFLMGMFERQHVITSADTQSAWGHYGNFYRNFIHAIKSGTKDYVVIAHTDTTLNTQNNEYETKVPIKGAVGRLGCEADFTTIVSAKRVELKKLKDVNNDLLHITEDDKEDGTKHVFVTRVTKDTLGEKMRSAMGLWERKELYIDNDIEQVFNRLHAYYN